MSSHSRQALFSPSVSLGAGIVYRSPFGRLEFNFALPIAIHASDVTVRGHHFQFGVGLNFM